MSNIVWAITVPVGAVAIGVSVWFASKQRQLKQEQKHHQETERRLLAQMEQQRHQSKELERHRLAQLEEVSLKDLNQQLNQETTTPESHMPSAEDFNGESQTGIGDLENSLTKDELTTPTSKRIPNFVSKLCELLASKKWDKADKETLKIMLQVTGREKEGWLDVASIQNFPCEELRAIDQLWLQFSNGRFGFSVQKRIWKSVGGNLKADDKIYQAFGDRVGWRVNGNWIQIHQLSFISLAAVGHLPATAIRLGGLSWGVDGFWWEKREAYVFLLSKKNW